MDVNIIAYFLATKETHIHPHSGNPHTNTHQHTFPHPHTLTHISKPLHTPTHLFIHTPPHTHLFNQTPSHTHTKSSQHVLTRFPEAYLQNHGLETITFCQSALQKVSPQTLFLLCPLVLSLNNPCLQHYGRTF